MNVQCQQRGIRTLKVLLQSLFPLWIVLSSILLVLVSSPLWVPIEYRLPGFPPDPYGFTLEERERLSEVDLRYLLNDADLSYFEDYTLDDGSPMHNDRELAHMEDVKNLIHTARTVWFVSSAALLTAGLYLVRREGWEALRVSVSIGAKTTIILIVALIIGVAISFRFVFVGFHRIFFEGDTWLFRYSDTFIRLYPERFWRDTFIYMGASALLLSGGAWLWGRRER